MNFKFIYQMAEASFQGFIRTLAIIILFYYLIKFLIRIFAPILMQKAMQKVQQRMENQFKQQQNYQEATSHNTSQSKVNPQEKKKVGEYIDYEEVD